MNKELTNSEEEFIEEEGLMDHRLNKEIEQELKEDYYDLKRWL
ncbi:MAG: hypothetical protein ACOC56_06085 [Atribacterota bacterium]